MRSFYKSNIPPQKLFSFSTSENQVSEMQSLKADVSFTYMQTATINHLESHREIGSDTISKQNYFCITSAASDWKLWLFHHFLTGCWVSPFFGISAFWHFRMSEIRKKPSPFSSGCMTQWSASASAPAGAARSTDLSALLDEILEPKLFPLHRTVVLLSYCILNPGVW